MGLSITNHPFGGIPIYGNSQISKISGLDVLICHVYYGEEQRLHDHWPWAQALQWETQELRDVSAVPETSAFHTHTPWVSRNA